MLGTIISGGLGLLGGYLGYKGQKKANAANMAMSREQMAYNKAEAERNRKYQSEEAEKNRGWQEGMSNTAYQRALRDMRLAGINPLLMASRGGASTPGGAQGSGSQASSGVGANQVNSASSVSRALSNVSNQMLDYQAKKAQIKNIQADTQKKEAETQKTTVDKDLVSSNIKLTNIKQVSEQLGQKVNQQQLRLLRQAEKKGIVQIDQMKQALELGEIAKQRGIKDIEKVTVDILNTKVKIEKATKEIEKLSVDTEISQERKQQMALQTLGLTEQSKYWKQFYKAKSMKDLNGMKTAILNSQIEFGSKKYNNNEATFLREKINTEIQGLMDIINPFK